MAILSDRSWGENPRYDTLYSHSTLRGIHPGRLPAVRPGHQTVNDTPDSTIMQLFCSRGGQEHRSPDYSMSLHPLPRHIVADWDLLFLATIGDRSCWESESESSSIPTFTASSPSFCCCLDALACNWLRAMSKTVE